MEMLWFEFCSVYSEIRHKHEKAFFFSCINSVTECDSPLIDYRSYTFLNEHAAPWNKKDID